MGKKRAMSSAQASYVKRKGHADAREFAELLGLGKEYNYDLTAKKDVIDSEGHSYSVKSGQKKWQIFLYGRHRFQEDYTFRGMNGLGDLFLKCIDSFPEKREEYLKNKSLYKNLLKENMRELCRKLREKRVLAAFIDKSMFNSGEVDFLVIKYQDKFHIFSGKEVVKVLSENFEVENSKARAKNQMDDQKVVFKLQGKTCGEIEMRNDSERHYRQIKFWLGKNMTFDLLKTKIRQFEKYNEKIIIYGEAIKPLLKLKKKLLKNF